MALESSRGLDDQVNFMSCFFKPETEFKEFDVFETLYFVIC